ncbi:MAG: POTRA domain-containing protein [Planctomycetota bacterium]
MPDEADQPVWKRAAAMLSGLGRSALLAVFVPLLLVEGAGAQQLSSDFNGRAVREVRILVAPYTLDNEPADFGAPDERTDQIVRNQLRMREGAEYLEETATRDIATLNRLGRFSSIEHAVQPLSDGSVMAIYFLREQPIITDVQVVGNRKLSDQQLAAAVDLLAGTAADDQALARAARNIREMYRDRGFLNAEVSVDRDELAETGIVLFRIREGSRLRVTDLRFEGNQAFSRDRLHDELETREAGIFRRGALDEEMIERDAATLLKFYQDRGYLDARTDAEIRSSPDGREAIVTFVISEGPLYTLRDVVVDYEGEGTDNGRYADGRRPVLSREQIIGLIGMKPGDTYSGARAERAIQSIRDAYGKLGYYRPSRPSFGEFSINRRELRDPNTPRVDLYIRVDEGPRLRTGQIVISGNELTKQSVVRRQVQLLPDRPLDTTRLAETERRLAETRLFALGGLDAPFAGLPLPGAAVGAGIGGEPDVNLTDVGRVEPSVGPDGKVRDRLYRDVLVEVTETNTASFSFGATANSDDGLTGILTYRQNNFDLFDTPDSSSEFFRGRAFRGGGQAFQVSAQPGDRVQNYSVSLQDPALRDTNVSGSTSAFYRVRDFDDFSETRLVGTLGAGRRFGERWVGRSTIRLQDIDLDVLPNDSPVDFFDVQDKDLLTDVSFSLSRTTVDSRLRPTEGTALEFAVSQIGALGGDFDYTVLSASANAFLPLAESDIGVRTVLRLNSRVAYIPQGQSAVPFYERFYLGGTTFRGIDFRDVSPKGVLPDGTQSTIPVGGSWLVFGGIELQQPIVDENLALVVFTDTGTVTERPGFDEFRVGVGTGVRIYLPQLSPAPLAFDFGRALILGEGDGRNLFTFSIDLPF